MARKYVANPVRTAIQATPALVITEGVDAFVYDMSDKQYAALAGLLLLAFSAAQNAIEYYKGKALLNPETK